jgi:hypothetical protein
MTRHDHQIWLGSAVGPQNVVSHFGFIGFCRRPALFSSWDRLSYA